MEDIANLTEVKQAPKWRRFAIYFFAAIGLVLSLGIAVLAFQPKQKDYLTFDTDSAIDGVMNTNYGKYSESQRGWLYVDEQSKLTYLVTVVQQKKIEGKEGEELYFLTSGHAINSNSGDDAFYGAFQLRNNNGELYEYSDPRRASGAHAVKPGDVHFEKLSADVWGWVVKLTDIETGDGEEITNVRNVILAPRNNQIVLLGQFNAANSIIGSGGCEETERTYAEWKKTRDDKKTAAAASSEELTPEAAAELYDGEDYEPPRCTKLQWTYRTEPVIDSTFTPLHITRKPGMEEGVAVEGKKWKVMFDPKSYTYLLPEELKNSGL